jgi:hypothetical protein
MARIEDIERRLLNWQRWKIGRSSGGLGYSTIDLTLANGGRDGYVEARVPTMDCEAEETDRAVNALASHLRATVEALYLGNGMLRHKAARLCVSEATLYARRDQAHRHLQAWFAEQAMIKREHRDRLEAMQRSARP